MTAVVAHPPRDNNLVFNSGLTSAAGFISLLEEEEPELQVYALENLNAIVNEFWAEISDSIKQIEVLNENTSFPARQLAALVASKVYYNIGAYESAMHYALEAGNLFDINDTSQYTRTLVLKCIDEYIRQQNVEKNSDDADSSSTSDVPLQALEKVVEEVFKQAISTGEYRYALGVALESKRLDKVREIIESAGKNKSSDNQNGIHQMLDYCFTTCTRVVISREFRQQVLKLLEEVYRNLTATNNGDLSEVNWPRLCEILIFLDESNKVAHILIRLLEGSVRELLTAYQIGFDLCENSSQQFRTNVKSYVSKEAGPDVEQRRIQENYQEFVRQKEVTQPSEVKETDTMEQDEAGSSSQAPKEQLSVEERKKRLDDLLSILSGTTSINLFLEFLHRNNHTDKFLLKSMKTAIESRASVYYSALLISNAFMSAGTTNDLFLRDNMEWITAATNWSKFTYTAGIGVIQKGHIKESQNILKSHLPQIGGGGSPYTEGGALYALGLIHANHGEEAIPYLRNALNNAGTNEIVQHGCCLGLGVAAMATQNIEIFGDLRDKVLFPTDSAVAGEAAGMAMGLVMLGSGGAGANGDDEVTIIQQMMTYAHETQHEKIIRGLAIGLALIMCGREEEADGLIEQLGQEKDPILRYGGMYTIALAYAGTANNKAIKKLLHVAVSDVSDDVRRAAVIALGFLLFTQPEQCPKLVSLLSESYNPHVRYGATLAVGISCAGTGLKAAVDLLEPLATGDPVDFVRQGALIALAMVLVQTSSKQEPRVESIRKLFSDRIADKHEDAMAKFGACLAQGIIDAGGRNVTISPVSLQGGGGMHKNISSIVGLAVFTQYWYWHPLAYFLSLSFTPTAVIGLNKDLKMPVWQFKSNARPSLFGYPPEVKPPTAKAAPKLKSAELSTTRKARQRAQASGKMEEDSKKAEEEKKKKEEDKMEEDKKDKAKEKKEEEKPEPEFEELKNPARVTFKQRNYLTFDENGRYKPVKGGRGDVFGIVILRDDRPGEEESFVTPAKPAAVGETSYPDEADEPAPPEKFEYDPEKEL
eukprot:TRINITY_DN3915_c0_g2_i1.p1 TRINITY_DN3915_c0_g2~~TRINITY_DN3915_c0_g2_i1.p1  ORF type:complete len:1045 (-),score=328.52 TRINITY_DN3915_c0_g2_i1:23-3157(-)